MLPEMLLDDYICGCWCVCLHQWKGERGHIRMRFCNIFIICIVNDAIYLPSVKRKWISHTIVCLQVFCMYSSLIYSLNVQEIWRKGHLSISNWMFVTWNLLHELPTQICWNTISNTRLACKLEFSNSVCLPHDFLFARAFLISLFCL